MPDYSECKMYIILDDNWDCYIGHTVQELKRRLQIHKRPSNVCLSKQMMSNNPIIELLEDYPCKDVKEARHREQYWMEQFPNRLNKINAIVDEKAYNRAWELANPDKKLLRRQRHSLKAKETRKNKPKFTCECGTVVAGGPFSINRHNNSKFHINYNLTQLHNNDSPNV